MNHDDFIKTAELSMDCIALLARTDSCADWQKGAGHYQLVIKRGDKSFTTEYSCGPGIIEQWMLEQPKASWRRWGHDKSIPRGILKPSVHFREVSRKAREEFRPTLSDVLQCLQSDVMGLGDTDSFEEWVWEFGYDEDSRKAERIYNACKRIVKELGNLFGAELYETFITEVEED